MRNAVLALDGKLVAELPGQRATEGGEIQQREGKCTSLDSTGLKSRAGERLNPRASEVPGASATHRYMLQEQGRQRARSRSVCGLQPPCYPLTDAKLTAATSCPPEQSTDQGTLGRGQQTGESAALPERLGERELFLTSLQAMQEASLPKTPLSERPCCSYSHWKLGLLLASRLLCYLSLPKAADPPLATSARKVSVSQDSSLLTPSSFQPST